jgi:hypothetical protein
LPKSLFSFYLVKKLKLLCCVIFCVVHNIIICTVMWSKPGMHLDAAPASDLLKSSFPLRLRIRKIVAVIKRNLILENSMGKMWGPNYAVYFAVLRIQIRIRSAPDLFCRIRIRILDIINDSTCILNFLVCESHKNLRNLLDF